MRPGVPKDNGPPRKRPSETYTWLDHMIRKDPGIMGQLPCLYLKCTSMIMNTMNFSIDYSAPFIPNLLKSSANNSVTQRTSQLNSPSQQKFSKSGYQVSQTDYDSNNKIIPQALNKPTNVRMSLQYLGTGILVTNEVIKPKDELSMFQQVCGGESICVFKGYVSPGDTFQIISRRHYGYPFSASIYINGLIAARISWCCEYRNHVGFQQGRRGCFRITQLSGGKPCNRCAEFNSQKKYQIKPGGECSVARTCERSVTSQEKEKTMGTMEIMTWSTQSLYTAPSNKQPATPEVHEPPARRRRRVKKKTTPKEESDSEQENKLYNKYQRPRKPHLRDSRKCANVSSLGQHKDKEAEHSGKSAVNDGNEELAATQRPGETRGYSEGQEDQYSTPSGTASSAQKHCTDSVRLHAEQHDGTQSIHRKLAMALGEGSRCSDVELSDSSDSSGTHASTANHRAAAFSNDVRSLPVPEQQVAAERQIQDGEEIADACSHISGAEVAGEDDLVCQISDLTTVLRECDEVDQLVLRNTGMTDSLLRRLASAIAGSKSEVESINLNLNEISPDGAETIIHLLRKKPSIKSVLLYGNQLGDEGITTFTRGLSELWRIDSISRFQLSELDIGGNQLGREGLRSVASFLQLNPPLRHLGLAHSAVQTWDSWQELFDAIKRNTNLTHLLLDENSLGDAGARLVAEVIQVNRRLLAIDLDSNEIGEEGGRAIMENLASNTGSALTNISLDNNSISTGTREIIAKLLSLNTNNGDLL